MWISMKCQWTAFHCMKSLSISPQGSSTWIKKRGSLMRNLLKVARWEIKRNLKNRSFLIGLFITPAILFGFMLLGNVFDDSDHREDPTVVYVHDKLGIFDHIRKTVDQHQLNWKMKETDIREAEVETKLKSEERTAYIFLDDRALEEGLIPVYTSEEMEPAFMQQIHVLEFPIQ